MTDSTQGATPVDAPADKPQDVAADKGSGKTPIESLPTDVQEYIRELRRENEKRRKTEDSIKAAADEQVRKAEEDRLANDKKWQELAEKRAKELDTLKPIQERYKALEEAFLATLTKRIEKVPDAYKSALDLIDDPIKKMLWLDANEQLFAQRQAPRLDAGTQGDATNKMTITLSAEQRLAARRANMTEDQYAAQIKARQERERKASQ